MTPGAKIATVVPKLEKDARVSVVLLAATAMTPAADAGVVVEASALEFPAAATIVKPAVTIAEKASFAACEKEPPSDMLIKALLTTPRVFASWRAHWHPAITPDSEPEPVALRTLTPIRVAALQTPYVLLPIVPA